MTQKSIEKTLNYRLSEFLESYPMEVDYPGVGYAPTQGTPYLKIDYIHSETFQRQLGTDSPNRASGVYQITVNTESNQGTKESSTIINNLKEFFKTGTRIIRGDNKVRITNFYLGSYVDDADWYREVVNIVFRSDITN